MNRRIKVSGILILCGILLIVISSGLLVYRYFAGRENSNTQADQLLSQLKEALPDHSDQSETERDKLSVYSVKGYELAGILKMPDGTEWALSTKETTVLPQIQKNGKNLTITGTSEMFSDFSEYHQGNKFVFTDVYGVHHTYILQDVSYMEDRDKVTDYDLVLISNTKYKSFYVATCREGDS